MSKFLTQKEISSKLLGYAFIREADGYLTKSQVVSYFSNEDYDETKLNNVKGDNYFVTDDDIVQSPRYALHVTLDAHVKSVTISVVDNSVFNPISDNTSDDNDVSPSSLSGDTIIDGPTIGGGTIIDGPTIGGGTIVDGPTIGGGTIVDGPTTVGNIFIKIGKEKTITKNSTVYIPAGAGVNFSAEYDVGYKEDGPMKNIVYMTSERTVDFVSTEITTTHTHKNSGTVHVTFNKHNKEDILSYQVYHTYNNSTCTIQTGDINGTSATITTPTYENTRILFYSSNAGREPYRMRVDSSSNVTATAFNSDSIEGVQMIGPTLDLKNIKSGWSVNITIY